MYLIIICLINGVVIVLDRKKMTSTMAGKRRMVGATERDKENG